MSDLGLVKTNDGTSVWVCLHARLRQGWVLWTMESIYLQWYHNFITNWTRNASREASRARAWIRSWFCGCQLDWASWIVDELLRGGVMTDFFAWWRNKDTAVPDGVSLLLIRNKSIWSANFCSTFRIRWAVRRASGLADQHSGSKLAHCWATKHIIWVSSADETSGRGWSMLLECAPLWVPRNEEAPEDVDEWDVESICFIEWVVTTRQ